MATRSPSVAVLGAGGIMGAGMARNPGRAGLEVRGWYRSREKAEPLTGDGVTVFDAPAQAAEGADVALTTVSNADAVVEAMAEVECPTWIQTSTIGLSGTERCAALAERRRIAFVDAPVLGTKAPAELGELIVLASGPAGAREHVEPVFEAIAKKTMWVGGAGRRHPAKAGHLEPRGGRGHGGDDRPRGGHRRRSGRLPRGGLRWTPRPSLPAD